MFKLLPAQDFDALFFKMEKDTSQQYGAIGYIRINFGKQGNEFHPTWFDIQPNLKTVDFKTEFDDVINSLCDDGKYPPFASRKNLEAFRISTPGKDLSERGSGYMVRTLHYSYYFRCLPTPHDYEVYCFAYDNRFLLSELAKHNKFQ